MHRHSFAVRSGRDAPSAVREALRERGRHLSDGVRDDLLLLLTEVVTNAVRHSGTRAGEPIEVQVHEQEDCVRVEVVDSGHGFEPPERLVPDLTRTGGLGLVLVDRISRAWGVRRSSQGATVWFELDNHDGELGSDASRA